MTGPDVPDFLFTFKNLYIERERKKSGIPSGNLTVCYANSPLFMGKLQLYGHVKWQTATDYQSVSFMIYQQFSNSAIQTSLILIKLQRAMRAMMSPSAIGVDVTSTIGVSRCFKGTSEPDNIK